jgi:hypothetical protein
MLALARAGVEEARDRGPDWAEVTRSARRLPEDTQGVFLLLARAALRRALPGGRGACAGLWQPLRRPRAPPAHLARGAGAVVLRPMPPAGASSRSAGRGGRRRRATPAA